VAEALSGRGQGRGDRAAGVREQEAVLNDPQRSTFNVQPLREQETGNRGRRAVDGRKKAQKTQEGQSYRGRTTDDATGNRGQGAGDRTTDPQRGRGRRTEDGRQTTDYGTGNRRQSSASICVHPWLCFSRTARREKRRSNRAHSTRWRDLHVLGQV
jgi:hypothetical protein